MIGLSKKEIKILSLHDVIRLKQVDHVKNEKNILKVPPRSIYLNISISPYIHISSYISFSSFMPQSGVTLSMVTKNQRCNTSRERFLIFCQILFKHHGGLVMLFEGRLFSSGIFPRQSSETSRLPLTNHARPLLANQILLDREPD